MTLLTAAERHFAEAIAALAFGNQFLPERVAHERRALGREYVATGPVWHNRLDSRDADANILKLKTRVGALLERLRARLAAGADPGPHRELYAALVLYHLYYQYDQKFQGVITECL